jgi:hypothetical protein
MTNLDVKNADKPNQGINNITEKKKKGVYKNFISGV